MKVGFTGTKVGMTEAQRSTLRNFLNYPGITEFHHGDCVGADAQAHDMVRETVDDEQVSFIRVIIHPPLVTSKRAWKLGDELRNPRDYLQRNRNIVDAADVLVACPYEAVDRQRSGTWYTVRYARRKKKQVWVIVPSGEILE